MSNREKVKSFSGWLGTLSVLGVLVTLTGVLFVIANVSGEGNSANAASDGKAVFHASCVACHGTGVAGAPKLGDKAVWIDRIAQGNETLYQHALKGFQGKKGFMPPKGGNVSLPEADIKAAVDYMISKAK